MHNENWLKTCWELLHRDNSRHSKDIKDIYKDKEHFQDKRTIKKETKQISHEIRLKTQLKKKMSRKHNKSLLLSLTALAAMDSTTASKMMVKSNLK